VRDFFFTGIGNRFHGLADGLYTGKASKALKDFTTESFGVRIGQDGVQTVSHDMAAELDLNKRLNPLDHLEGEIAKFFRSKGMSPVEKRAWKERAYEYAVDPSKDAELAKQPELKKLVDAYITRRRERLKFQRENNVDVGDVGERSASRAYDPSKVLANREEFIKAAAAAYREKWGREAAEKMKRAQTFKQRGGEGDYERYEKLVKEANELRSRDGALAATEFFESIAAGERGVTSDGNDIFTPEQRGSQPNVNKAREFGAEADRHLGKFMIRDLIELDAHESRAAVRAVTRARMLATNENGVIDPIGKWKKLRAELDAEGNSDMQPMAAQLIKTYLGLRGADNPVVQKTLEFTHAFTQLAYLARAGFSNLPEPVLVGMRTGKISDSLRAYRIAGKSLYRKLKGMSPSESQVIADALGITKDGMNAMMGSVAMTDPFGGRGATGKLVGRLHLKTLLTQTAQAVHVAASEIARGFIHAELRMVKAAGKFKNLSLKNLNEIGISSRDVDRMVKFTDDLAKAKDPVAHILQDTPEAKMYRDAVTLFTRTGAALDPSKGGRSAFGHTPVGTLFNSLQSFLFEFQQKVLARSFARMKAGVTGKMQIEGVDRDLTPQERTKIGVDLLAGFSALYSANFAVQLVREYVFSDPERIAKDKRRTASEIATARAAAALSRTGTLGAYDLLYNMVTQARFKREPATVVLGPAIGGVSELFQGVVQHFNEDANTPNTNTAERKVARSIYRNIIAPPLTGIAASMPGIGISGLGIQAINHPALREVFVKGAAGPARPPRSGPFK
jgi:hypothetical protein